MFYDKMCRMVFGVVSFLFFTFIASNISAFRNVFFLFGGYLFIYFTIFSFIGLFAENIFSFHQFHNKKIHRQPVKYFMENKHDVVYAYKVILNVGFFIILFLVIKSEIL
ncbi:hypothetical protein DQE21_10050 [Salmonella enterica subsp. enterica serovar Alachua]|nr:hypothetical protein [Salmonella enterica subsp. enterica serovar Alachua]EAU7037951.1 hypothetical protein [Salmonella enterica]EBS0650216.1 hypothetical protein [Salmonella enterica subsp. enterica serovar Yolo]EAA6669315.1 hypothetical protein [Salmonella enterica subsp. enterica serovar Alachua]EAC0156585.1 hypothetical protein [Salmonella enterica subsp. enterica serovar Alachua]